MLSDNERPTQGRVKFFSLAASKNGNPAEPQGCRFILLQFLSPAATSLHLKPSSPKADYSTRLMDLYLSIFCESKSAVAKLATSCPKLSV
jgi:hypothetical protein